MRECPHRQDCSEYQPDEHNKRCAYHRDRSGVSWCDRFEMELINQPVQAGQIVELELTDTRDDGRCVGHLDGFAVLVDGGLPQFNAKVKILDVKKRYALAELEELLDEVEPEEEDDNQGRRPQHGRRDDYWG